MAKSIGGLNLVLLGTIGAGKSASGNTILGRKAFESKESFASVTRAIESRTVRQRRVTVYDTPGLFNTELSDDEVLHMINEKVLQKCESGPCVFLLVIKADRFTEKERITVEKIEQLLGEKRLEKTWILFTGRDELEEDDITIDEFIDESEALKNLVQKYDQRYHVFNNKTKKHTGQVQELLTKINATDPDTIEKGAKPYTPKRIVILGQSGVGKSAAGNTILGKKVFRSKARANSVTSKCSVKHATVSGRSVSVVDTPGFFDTQMDSEELMTEIERSVYLSSPGPHAFLIVFDVNVWFYKNQQIPQIIKIMFGQEVLKYSIILSTHGDLLDGESVEELIKENCTLRDLVQQCGGRFHVFNNEDQNNREQVNDLLQKIDTMIEKNGGGHYSNQMYEDAQRFRRDEEEQRKKKRDGERKKRREERKRRDRRRRGEMERGDRKRRDGDRKKRRDGERRQQKEKQ